MLHAAKAALLAEDLTATSHAAVRRLFGQHLVKSGAIEKEWAEILAREQDQRISIDYDVDFELDPEQAASIVGDARRFLDRMRKHLAARGVSVAVRKDRN